jgi:acetylornithine/succinyldiaminopimelate/putrescine aminotransferase
MATSRVSIIPAIIVMEQAFHGRTMATLSATGNRKVQAGFEPLVSGFVRVPYNDLEAIRAIAEHNKNIVAVMLEIVQGEGGINIADLIISAAAQALRRKRLAADLRRGAVRHGADGNLVRLSACRHSSRMW